jgi:NDP-sugar pyrophosphorylase family protein
MILGENKDLRIWRVKMRVVILAAGLATRLFGVEKALLPIGGQFLIQYSLENAVLIEPEEIIVVVRKGSKIPEVFGRKYKKVPIKYKVQSKPLGTMDALEKVRDYLGLDTTYLMLADEILIEPKVERLLDAYIDSNVDGVIGYVKEDNPEEIKKTYNILNNGEYAIKLVEKPREIFTNLKGTGYCIFSEPLLEKMLESGEKNFVEALDWVLQQDSCIVKIVEVCKKYFNINTFEDLEICRRYLEQR